MGHGHGHGHGAGLGGSHLGSHGSGHPARADRRYLAGALALLVVFMAAEVVVGIIANSIALISDAGHMLTDAASIVLALIAMSMAARPARGAYTFGYKRAEILSAAINGLTFVLLVVYFVYEGSGGSSSLRRWRACSSSARRSPGSPSTRAPPGSSPGPTGAASTSRARSSTSSTTCTPSSPPRSPARSSGSPAGAGPTRSPPSSWRP
nr:hypothetical protein GCM10020093_038940 [Planobispora longispora]